jgi:hypothetical protein
VKTSIKITTSFSARRDFNEEKGQLKMESLEKISANKQKNRAVT